MFQAAAYNGDNSYTFVWDFDNDGEYDDALGNIASNRWNIPGVYWISLKVTDGEGSVDIYDTIVAIEFGASTPSKPNGNTNIKAGVSYAYETNINTQGGYWNKVYYKYSWGDGTESDWLESPTASHIWESKSIYQVKAKALLIHESSGEDDAEDLKETDWSDPLSISLTRSASTPGPIIRLLQYFLYKYPNAFPILRQILGF